MRASSKKNRKLNADQATKLAKEYLETLAGGKAAYQKAGELLDQLAAEVGPGVGIPVDGNMFRVIDQFARSNKIFKHTVVSRFSHELTAA